MTFGYSLGNPRKARLPRTLSLFATGLCSSHCVMCGVGQSPPGAPDLSVDQFGMILRDCLFQRIRHVGISGGEPSLRSDLPSLVTAIANSIPGLSSLSITTDGLAPERWDRFLPAIQLACKNRRVALTLALSVDGVGSLHDQVRRVPGAFDRAMRTLEIAKGLQVTTQIQCTVSAVNAYGVVGVLDLAREQDTEVIFRCATSIARLRNEGFTQDFELDEDQRSFVADFLEAPAVQAACRSPRGRLYYRDLARRLASGGPRASSCHFQQADAVLTAQGELSSRIHDQTGPWPPSRVLGEVLSQSRAWRLARHALRAIRVGAGALTWLAISGWVLRARQRTHIPSVPASGLFLGCYGGEHVGDAAILGGVLARTRQQLGVETVHVASSRPHRTRRWVRSLELDGLKLDVCQYTGRDVSLLLKQVDCLVLAGGPLMDLPELLVRHLRTVASARRRGIPVIVEGVGIGPFHLSVSRWLAGRVLRLASKVTLRGADCGLDPCVRGVDFSVSQDPAFDYLRSRQGPGKLKASEAAWLEGLSRDGRGKRIVAINLRPLWGKYDFVRSQPLERLAGQFIEKLADGLTEFHRQQADVAYVFLPMNADQYGFSDLLPAHQLRRALPGGVDYRIWEAEPGVDAVLALLRMSHAVVAMRYHANVFALSQGLPSMGIDYSIGAPGKVVGLYGERGLSAFVNDVAYFSPEWLVTRLARLLPPTEA